MSIHFEKSTGAGGLGEKSSKKLNCPRKHSYKNTEKIKTKIKNKFDGPYNKMASKHK